VAVNETLTCALVEERALVERYVADKLTDEQEREDFEAHVIACPRCQDEIRLAMTVRAELAPLVAMPGRARRVWPFGLGLALAAGIAAVVLFRGGGRLVGTKVRKLRWLTGAVPADQRGLSGDLLTANNTG